MSNIGKILSDRRKELHLTLEEVGNAVGVSKSTVKKWETGYISNMRRDKISALSKILDLNVNIIIDEDDDAPLFDPKELLAAQEQADRDSEQYRQEQTILECFRNVNEEGKAAILKYVKYIASDDEYKKCDTDIKDIKGA